jgi:hypothetical protein
MGGLRPFPPLQPVTGTRWYPTANDGRPHRDAVIWQRSTKKILMWLGKSTTSAGFGVLPPWARKRTLPSLVSKTVLSGGLGQRLVEHGDGVGHAVDPQLKSEHERDL